MQIFSPEWQCTFLLQDIWKVQMKDNLNLKHHYSNIDNDTEKGDSQA